jgi:hypothetical protein
MPPIHSACNPPTLAPIIAVIRTAIAVAWIGVPIAWISVTVSGIPPIVVRISRIRVTWGTTSVAWITRTDVDADALGGCFERHKQRHAKNGAHKDGGCFFHRFGSL